jgi:PAS domain S-box-containing protein
MNTDFIKKLMLVLHLEDNENDHILTAELLREHGLKCEFSIARNHAEFARELGRKKFDLIISDFSLPSYDGLSALSLAQEMHPETPFIFFSGTIGEEIAVESLKNGATDYVLKQRPKRLVAAVRRALINSAERARLKRAETSLQQSEERFRIVARATNDVIWEWDIQAGRFYVSENFRPAFGHDFGEKGLSADDFFSLIHADDKTRVITGISTLLASGGSVWWSEHRLCRVDGSYAHVLDRASIVYDANRKPARMVGVTIDISERKRAEQKIQEQTQLLEKAHDAIIVLGEDRLVSYWNKGAEKIYGWTAGEAVGRSMTELAFKGTTMPQLDQAIQTVETSGEWLGDMQEFTKDGRSLIIRSRCNTVRDENGNPKAWLIIGTDITERKQLEEQFIRAQRLESLGLLVSGIAHDLNNCLAPVTIGITMLRDEALSEEARGLLDMMETTTRRSVEMIRQVLTFARGGGAARTTLRIKPLAHELIKILTDTFPKNIACRLEVETDAWPVTAIATQLHQVLMNLCINARDAMPEGGAITLSIANVQLDSQALEHQPTVVPGKFLCLSVSDTGAGIPPENLHKIFQPFFTTKAPGKGTGLGLASSQAIIRNHGGFIDVESTPGRGTTFKVFLPAGAGETKACTAPGKAALPAGHGERILIVDDEATVLAIERTTLENFGYRVSTAANGVEAVSRIKSDPEAFDLVITDLAMPLMNGWELIAELRKIRPGIKILTATGSLDKWPDLKDHFNMTAVIPKPFTAEKLLQAVHQVLAGTQS